MKQFSFGIKGADAVVTAFAVVKRYLQRNEAKSVLVHLYAGRTDKRALLQILSEIRRELPQAEIVGASSGGEVCAGVLTEQTVLAVVDVFTETEIKIRHYYFGGGQEEAVGQTIRTEIDRTNDIKAAELLIDSWGIRTRKFLEEINECKPMVRIFGAVPYAHDVKEPMFVFTGEQVSEVTAILITYAGKDFHITTDYVVGWKPMGTAMTVTKADGKLLYEIDHEPALAVYDKYLKIPNDENFYRNAFEFPFLRYVNDTYMMRMPFFSTEDGAISLVASVEEGDTLYLSYGDISTILNEIYDARTRLTRFHPQYVRLHNCASRKMFWGDRIDKEVKPFQSVAETAGFFTGGEIMRVNGALIHFNATLLVIGMREGAPDPSALLAMDELRREDRAFEQQTSMVRRMAHFINVATQELMESNRRLQRLATTDELTRVLNRRELNRIVTEYHEGGRQFSLVMIDLDDFKRVNDTYGHATGDQVLQETATLIKNAVSHIEDAAVGRWGGEEFMIFLPGQTLEEAEDTAEHLRVAMVDYRFEKIRSLTISVGVADSKIYADMRSIYHDVDRALYTAKQAGKNRVVVAQGRGDEE